MDRTPDSAWGNLTVPSGSVLLCVDVQHGFINRHTEHVPRRLADLVERHGDCFAKVVATLFVNRTRSHIRRLLDWHEMESGPDTDLHPAVEVIATQVLEKDTYTQPGLVALSGLGAGDRVYVTGIDTEACVLANAFQLFEAGIEPIVLAGACASTGGRELHEFALSIMARSLGEQRIVPRISESFLR